MATKPFTQVNPAPATIGRVFLCLGVGAAAAGVFLTTEISPGYAKDAELAILVRTMGALKLAAIFPLVFGAAWLRLRPEVALTKRAAYFALTTSSAAGIALIMALSHVGIGAFLFHAGFLGMLILISQDDGFVYRLKPAARWLMKR